MSSLERQGELILVPDVYKDTFLQHIATDEALKPVTDQRCLCGQHILDDHLSGKVDVHMK
jgi:hypothetical protein